jgi:hypothetical protein
MIPLRINLCTETEGPRAKGCFPDRIMPVNFAMAAEHPAPILLAHEAPDR